MDDVAPARADATTLVVARHASSIPYPAIGQARRSRGELKRKIKLHLPTSMPDQAIFALVLGRLPRLTV
jgi:hypothetical protein